MTYSILLIEDHEAVQSALVRTLSANGYRVRAVGTAAQGLSEIATNSWHLVLLDLGLPDLDGTAALQMIRAVSDVPVIVASARSAESSIVRLLEDGADDYVTKPFSAEQLLARITALLRRTTAEPERDPVLRVGDLHVDPSCRTVHLEGRAVELTRLEFDILAFLAAQQGRVVTRASLVRHVWQDAGTASNQTVDVHISWLRRKLGESAAAPRYLRTVRGVGLVLAPPR